MIIRFLAVSVFSLVSLAAATAQPFINYDVSWDTPSDHYFQVSIGIGNVVDQQVDVQMPAWRPGRYVMQNYSKYIVDFSAHSRDGAELPFEKVDKDTWRIAASGHDEIIVTYRNYANVLDAGESFLDSSEAYLNPISVLMNVVGRLNEPTGLTLQQPDGWRVATPLEFNKPTGSYVAADYHELVDSPFLVSPDFDLLSFEMGDTTFEIAIQGDWDYDEDRLIADHRAIVAAQAEIMQDVPFDRYLFMYHIPEKPMGHGVEHKNSTSIVLGPASALKFPAADEPAGGIYAVFLRVTSHELFHAWNVERIRPAAMYPTDYSREQYTTQMWIFEGITDYYADLALQRAGLTSEDSFLKGIANTIQTFDQDPGRKITSIAMSSFDSWVKQDNAPPGRFTRSTPPAKQWD